MKKRCLRLSDIKEEIMAYEGKEVKLAVNKGRNNVVKFEGVIDKMYPSVFTVHIPTDTVMGLHSYSYSEVLCGHVKITPKAA